MVREPSEFHGLESKVQGKQEFGLKYNLPR
jgi:hypothetical protein